MKWAQWQTSWTSWILYRWKKGGSKIGSFYSAKACKTKQKYQLTSFKHHHSNPRTAILFLSEQLYDFNNIFTPANTLIKTAVMVLFQNYYSLDLCCHFLFDSIRFVFLQAAVYVIAWYSWYNDILLMYMICLWHSWQIKVW